MAATELNSLDLISDANLVSYWRFEGNYEDTIGSNDGTGRNTSLGTDYGKFGQGVYTPNNADITITDNATVDITTNWWWHFWAKTDDTTFSDYRAIISKYGPHAYEIGIEISSGKIYYYSPSDGALRFSTYVVPDANWHMYDIYHSTDRVYFVVDNVAKGDAASASTTVNNANLGFGHTITYGAQYFRGKMDDIALFSRVPVISAGVDIDLLYNGITNYAPNTPTNSSPSDAATNQSRQLTLTGSAYSDTESDAHTASQWQVATDSGFSSVVWDSGETATNKTSVVVNSTNGTFSGALSGKSRLAPNTQYYWHVKYKD